MRIRRFDDKKEAEVYALSANFRDTVIILPIELHEVPICSYEKLRVDRDVFKTAFAG